MHPDQSRKSDAKRDEARDLSKNLARARAEQQANQEQAERERDERIARGPERFVIPGRPGAQVNDRVIAPRPMGVLGSGVVPGLVGRDREGNVVRQPNIGSLRGAVPEDDGDAA